MSRSKKPKKSNTPQTPIGFSESGGLLTNIVQLCESIRKSEAERMAKLLTRLAAIEALVIAAEKK